MVFLTGIPFFHAGTIPRQPVMGPDDLSFLGARPGWQVANLLVLGSVYSLFWGGEGRGVRF